AHGRDNVVDRASGDLQVRDRKLLAALEGKIFHDPPVLIPQLRKARVDVVVENVTLQQIDHFLRSVNANRLSELTKKIVDKYREARDVIHVRMGHDNVAYGATLLFGQSQSNAAGINRHAIVN